MEANNSEQIGGAGSIPSRRRSSTAPIPSRRSAASRRPKRMTHLSDAGVFDYSSAVGRRRLRFAGVFAGVFTLVDIFAQLASLAIGDVATATNPKAPYLGATWHFGFGRLLLALIGSFVICWLVLAGTDWLAQQRALSRSAYRPDDAAAHAVASADRSSRRNGSRIAARLTALTPRALTGIAVLVPLLAWTFMYLRLYPIASMNDTAFILWSPFQAAPTHPIAYNLLVSVPYQLGMKMSGMLLGVVLASLMQMLAWAGALAYISRWLDRRGASRIVIAAMVLVFALVPIFANYSFALVKDSPFAIFAVLLIPVMVDTWNSRGANLSSPWSLGWATFVLTGFGLLRNNALPVAIILALILLWRAQQNRARAGIMAAIAIIAVLIPPAIYGHGNHISEAAGIPMQQVGYMQVMAPECISSDAHQKLDKVLPAKIWAAAYHPTSVDPTKYARGFNVKWMNDHRSDFASAWLSAATTCPVQASKAYLAHTSRLWRLDASVIGADGQSSFTSAVSNYPANRTKIINYYTHHGVTNQSLLPIELETMQDGAIYLMQLTPGPGTWAWLCALVATAMAYRRNRNWIPVLLPSALIWATYMVASPTMEPFRYFYPIAAVTPILVAVALTPTNRENQLNIGR